MDGQSGTQLRLTGAEGGAAVGDTALKEGGLGAKRTSERGSRLWPKDCIAILSLLSCIEYATFLHTARTEWVNLTGKPFTLLNFALRTKFDSSFRPGKVCSRIMV